MAKGDLNYYQTFITVAPDSTATAGETLKDRGKKPNFRLNTNYYRLPHMYLKGSENDKGCPI